MGCRTSRAWVLAGACLWAVSAGAGGMRGAQGDRTSGVEPETPAAVYESAPWAGGKARTREHRSNFEALPAERANAGPGVGASSGASGSGSVGSDALAAGETTEYWLIGSEDAKPNVGASASDGAGGSVSFDASTQRSGR